MTGPVDLSQSYDASDLERPSGHELSRLAPRTALQGGRTVPERPESLVELAILEKVDVSIIERLVALQERVAERNGRAAYFRALADAQEEFPEIAKNKKAKILMKNGGEFSYPYAPLDSIARAIRPVLRKYGFSYSHDIEPGGAGVLNVVCTLRHIDGHAERSTFPVPTATEARMSAAQANGAALTYGKRQSLVAVLGLTTVDPDTDAAREKVRDTKKITATQAADLDALIDEVFGTEAERRRKQLLKFLGVETLTDIPAGDYAKAVKQVEDARGKE